MNIILFTKYIGSPLTLRTVRSGLHLILVYVLLITAVAGLFYSGYWLGQAEKMNLAGASIFKSEKDYIQELKLKIAKAKQNARTDLLALNLNLQRLRLHVTRLDHLGLRLIQQARLSGGEYNFAKPAKPLRHVQLIKSLNGIEQFYAKLESMDLNVTPAISLTKKSEAPNNARLVGLIPNYRPGSKPVAHGRVISQFGYRIHPQTGQLKFHEGVDFAAKRGAPVYAVADGVVTKSERHRGYGYLIEINHGQYSTRYAHNMRNLVKKGQRVVRGQEIALVGHTGNATGAHLHFEVLNQLGISTDPNSLLQHQIMYQADR